MTVEPAELRDQTPSRTAVARGGVFEACARETLLGYSQIVLCGRVVCGALVLASSLLQPLSGGCGLLAAGAAALVGRGLPGVAALSESGMLACNGGLAGMAVAARLCDARALLLAPVAGVVCALVAWLCHVFLHRRSLPAMSLPFVLTTWLLWLCIAPSPAVALLEVPRRVVEILGFLVFNPTTPSGLLLLAGLAARGWRFALWPWITVAPILWGLSLLGVDPFRADLAAMNAMLTVVALVEVPPSETHRYGIAAGKLGKDGRVAIDRLVEKPKAGTAPSSLAVFGRYVLPPDVFDILERTRPGAGGEIQLTDALDTLAREGRLVGCIVEGVRYDAGDRLGYLKANIGYALKRPDLRDGLLAYMRELTSKE